ncbi:hypothetical protein Pse7367_2916 [Thalassoporum mexicanum PCC 7367]|uniref:LOG family protein n=1 Tax=Thalassoporum mexicanum TaxID=3457544 RepID=UPI00029FD504|nr:LOG family protein [Pseudanabaena sp. PCC 7367]AFY71169.1 hypothetical protein Pse7367_2916 [Pseudanabaena sp. PCC 7367]
MTASNPLNDSLDQSIDQSIASSQINCAESEAALCQQLYHLIDQLPEIENGGLIRQALSTLAQISSTDADRLDWKLIVGSLTDIQRAIAVFHPHRHRRKVSMFGSSRTKPGQLEYQQALKFAKKMTQLGFEVITGAGGGIMAAGNEGAGEQGSFGLNIDLPFEQDSNPYVQESSKLVEFKYFFTRKLFFVSEADAIALFPGGFGTQDELFECLTLTQTGKSTPKQIVLIDKPGGNYWQEWDEYMREHILDRQLISPEDRSLYTITDNIDRACELITNFYQVYHSSRWVGDLFVIRLNQEISDTHLASLNRSFKDIVRKGDISRCGALKAEKDEPEIANLPRLIFYFDRHSYGRLHELIEAINQVD